MIKAITCIAVVGAALLLAPGAFAAGGTDEKAAKQDPQWNVRVEVLMVAMPQERALALLPYLRDPAEIDGAVTEIMKDIDSKEAALTGYPVVETVDGGWAVAEGVTEQRYPLEFEPESYPPINFQPPTPVVSSTSTSPEPVPMAFSIREVGPTLEVTPHVSANGQWITLSIVPQRVELLGFDSFQTGKTAGGASYNIPQPRYFTTKTEAKLKLRNGQRCLIGVYKLVKPENQIEFFILQAVATPTK